MTVRWNDPFQPHLAGMREHGHIIIRQMAVVPDGLPLGLADQLGQSALAFDQQRVAQVAVVQFDQVEGVQHRFLATPFTAQCNEVRCPVLAGNHGLSVAQERMRVDAERGVNDGAEAVGPVMTVAGEAVDAPVISAHHQAVAVMLDFVNPQLNGRGTATFVGRRGSIKPEGGRKIMADKCTLIAREKSRAWPGSWPSCTQKAVLRRETTEFLLISSQDVCRHIDRKVGGEARWGGWGLRSTRLTPDVIKCVR